MREIKFRAWAVKPKIMFCVDRIIWRADKLLHVLGVYDDFKNPIGGHADCIELEKDLILMQFTGLLDKNGKEIYEGDIVRHIERNRGWTETTEKVVDEVIQCEGYNKWTFLWAHYKYEVIGNIYQDEGLLSG